MTLPPSDGGHGLGGATGSVIGNTSGFLLVDTDTSESSGVLEEPSRHGATLPYPRKIALEPQSQLKTSS